VGRGRHRARTDPITAGLRVLNRLAKRLKQRRIQAGALFLASPEVRFSLENDSQDPVDVGTAGLNSRMVAWAVSEIEGPLMTCRGADIQR
jgi:exoribonuclease R